MRPRGAARPVPPEVDEHYAADFREASTVLSDSPKASAALSRRCLQTLLRDKVGVKPGDLYNEIQQVLDTNQLPSYLADDLDAVRSIGNFAAHPVKSKSSGEIVTVEPGEAEWTLNVLEELFDFYFVKPVQAAKRRNSWNQKIGDAGKPPLRQTSAAS